MSELARVESFDRSGLRWRITKERIRVRPLFPGEIFRPYWSFMAWSVYYGGKRVARYRHWPDACDHIAVAHRKFGI